MRFDLLLFAFASPDQRACPDPRFLAAFVDQAMDEVDRARIREHIVLCDSCFDAVNQLSQLEGQALPEVPVSLKSEVKGLVKAHTPAQTPLPVWRLAAAAAVVLFGVSIGVSIWRSNPDLPAEVGARPSAREVRSLPSTTNLTIVAPKADAVLFSDRVQFSWKQVPGAIFYQVSVLDLEGNLAWQTRVSNRLSVMAPPSALKPGNYFVSVQASLPSGRLVKGDFVRFSLR